jgi:hypothetical protein
MSEETSPVRTLHILDDRSIHDNHSLARNSTGTLMLRLYNRRTFIMHVCLDLLGRPITYTLAVWYCKALQTVTTLS